MNQQQSKRRKAMFTKSHRRRFATILPALAAGMFAMLSASSSHATMLSVGQKTYRLCPQLIGGDDEFNGNGPDVDATFTLRRGTGNDEIFLDAYMHAIETRSDYTEGEVQKTFSLGSSPTGTKFTQIWAPGPNGAYQWISLGIFPSYGTAKLTYIDTDTTLDRFYNPQWWLTEVDINGDTDGGDVVACGNGDTYLTARLPLIWFWYS
jgi:hypothetical protein